MIRLKQFMKKTKIFLEEKTSFGFFCTHLIADKAGCTLFT